MNKSHWLSYAIAMLMSGCLFAADASQDSGLALVVSALQPILEKQDPKPEISYRGNELVIAYKSQMYKIHGRSMTGEVSPNAHDELGPSFKGFVLRVHPQSQGVINQVATPQTVQAPYWRTYMNETPLPGTETQIFWSLSYGVRTDTKLLKQIKQTLRDLNDARSSR